MKKILTLSLMLLVLALSASALAALPAVGDQLHGFTVTELDRIDSLDADVVKLSHDLSGAGVYFILNDDANMGFSICFHTEPTDNAGMLHILEHAVCASSEKYPGQDVFFDAYSQAYMTALNAQTSLSATNYFVTSMDENQLEMMADFYLDCAFHSALNTQPNYFAREGWRYELPTLDSDLTISGIVYNEMQGSYDNIIRAALHNSRRTLFPDTYQALESGGLPENIPELSYDELMDFYKSCYTPANSVTMIYGDVDMERFLKLLGEGYFDQLAPGIKAPISEGQEAFDAPVAAAYDFPVAADSQDTGAVMFYSVVLSDEDSADCTNLALGDVLTTVLMDESTPLMQALNASGIASSYGAQVTTVGTQLVLDFYAIDADAARAEDFKQILLDQLTAMAEAGLNHDLLSSTFSSIEMSLRLRRNSGTVAQELFSSLIEIQETGSDDYLNPAPWYQRTEALCVPGYAEGRLMDWVISNPHAALVSTVPAPGMLEQNERALADKLAGVKAAMTDEELAQLVANTAALSEWGQQLTPQSTLDKLAVVDPATVQVKLVDAEIATLVQDGITIHTAPSSIDMVLVNVLLNVDHLTTPELIALRELTCLTAVSTELSTQEEISVRAAALVSNLYMDVDVIRLEGGAYIPVLKLSWYAPVERVSESVDLAFEMLTQTDLEANAELLMQMIDAHLTQYRQPESVYSMLSNMATASQSGRNGLLNSLQGFPAIDVINDLKQTYETSPKSFIDHMTALRKKAVVRTGARLMLIGDAEGAAQASIMEKLRALPEVEGAAAQRQDLSQAKHIAVVSSSPASYFVRATMLEDPALDVTGSMKLLCSTLQGQYLIPNLRLQLGAYSTFCSVTQDGRWYTTYYRGASPFKANEIVMDMGDYAQTLDMTQSQLDAYKLPVISGLVTPNGELNDILNQMYNGLYGMTADKLLSLVDEIRSVTVEDMMNCVPQLNELMENSGFALITNASDLAGHEDEFDHVLQMP